MISTGLLNVILSDEKNRFVKLIFVACFQWEWHCFVSFLYQKYFTQKQLLKQSVYSNR